MKEGPDIALIGSLIGEPARANMLSALMNGIALTATELAAVAGITAQTASTHLKKLEDGGLLKQRKQGRHRYYCLADDEVASVLEILAGLAQSKGHVRVRTGPKDPALRQARICYNHLAGEMGVQMYDSLVARKFVMLDDEALSLTDEGKSFVNQLGIDVENISKPRRVLCKPCLDWSVRRSHLAGTLGTSLLNRFFELGWAKRENGSRIIQFSNMGKSEFDLSFPMNF